MNDTWRSNRTIVTSQRGRCHFEEFLNGIVLIDFFENEILCLYIFLNNNTCVYFRKILFILAQDMGVSDIQSTQVPLEKRQNSTMWKS